jgi:hypothetical protein
MPPSFLRRSLLFQEILQSDAPGARARCAREERVGREQDIYAFSALERLINVRDDQPGPGRTPGSFDTAIWVTIALKT